MPPELIDKQFVSEFLRHFRLSISALNTYLDCPLGFYFEHILQLPSEPSAAAQYGQAVHFALRKLFGEMLRSKEKQFPERDEFVNYFTAFLQHRQPYFEPKTFGDWLKKGQGILPKYYQQFVNLWSKTVIVERTVAAHIEGVPVRGVLDKIEFKLDNAATVVDYKTGKPNDDRLRRPTAKNPNGGAYWRQLVFYKLLYENYRANLVRVTTGEISYLEPDGRGNFRTKTLDLTVRDADILRGLIVENWAKIQAQQFDGCGKKTCQWCNFVKNNFTNASLRNEATEDLDD